MTEIDQLLDHHWNKSANELRQGIEALVARNAEALAAVVEAARELRADQRKHACNTCGGTGVAWAWPAVADLDAALDALDAAEKVQP